MIKKFLDKLMGKPANSVGAKASHGKRVEVPKADHQIDATLVDLRAVKVVQTLVDAGHEAYIVGGAVRDLLLGLRPKDFDVATDATPEQVKSLFRRAFIIGRRFRIVHVVFGRGRQDRGLSEVIEVSTFRALMDAAVADQVAGNEKTSKGELAGKSHVVDAEGRVLRDNVWGPQIEDAARRDFTVNAMYYDPVREIVVDYHCGIKDARKKLLRMIGDPETRYREDPVRIVRAVRFAAKLSFEIEPKTRAPIQAMSALLENVPQSRLFDEMIKLLQTGHALSSIEALKANNLHRSVFPVLDAVFDDARSTPQQQAFIHQALQDTDRRVNEGKPVAPSFLLACLLWHDVLAGWRKNQDAGEHLVPALQQAIDAVFDARIGDISGRGKLGADMREIWMMQPRFERRQANTAFSLIDQARFRAGFDFLRLRADVGEAPIELAEWWEDFSLGTDEEREALLETVREANRGSGRKGPAGRPSKATSSRAPASADEAAADGGPEESEPVDADEAEGAETASGAPARKRRRRRRKPAGGGSAPAGDAGGAPTSD